MDSKPAETHPRSCTKPPASNANYSNPKLTNKNDTLPVKENTQYTKQTKRNSAIHISRLIKQLYLKPLNFYAATLHFQSRTGRLSHSHYSIRILPFLLLDPGSKNVLQSLGIVPQMDGLPASYIHQSRFCAFGLFDILNRRHMNVRVPRIFHF